jgi:hypothetical protein
MNHVSYRTLFRNFLRPALGLASLFFGLSHINAQEVLIRQVADRKTDTYVEVSSLFSSPSLGGYHPIRVVMANNQLILHKIFLDFRCTSNYGTQLSSSSQYSFSVEPGKIATYDILVPLTPQNGQPNYEQFNLNLTGSMGSSSHNDSVRFGLNQPAVLISDTLHAPNGSSLDSELSTRHGGHVRHYSGTNQFASRFTPSQLPDDWRAYSGFDTMLLTDSDWSGVPPGAKNAILSWMRLGGHLIIYSASSPNPNSLGLPSDTSFGRYDIQPISGDRLSHKATVDFVFKREHDTRISAVTKDFDGKWPLQKILGDKSFNSTVFILVLIVFGIIVGPVNLFVFAKYGRRHRLFITTPIISIATSLLLIVLIIFEDGFGGEGQRLAIMEVRPDDNQNAAFVVQEQFSRTGVMTSPSFSIDASALFVPVPIDSNRWSRFTSTGNTSGNYDIQPSGGKLFVKGSWFQSRSEQGQLLTAVVPTRGRIEHAQQAGKIISTFDFPIKTLLFKDDDGKWHRAENLSKGKSVTLTSVDITMVQPMLIDLNKQFTNRNQSFFKKVQERNGHYIAITNEAPAIETHPSIDWETTTIITGPIVR